MATPHNEASPPVFTSSRLNSSTHLVIHNDKYQEFPYIYIKIYPDLTPPLAVVFDTGCGPQSAAQHQGGQTTELKSYISTHILAQLGHSTDWEWMVVCTHCHFDHIGGIQAFSDAGASIVASGFDEPFLRRDKLPGNSLCPAFGLPTPDYAISHFMADGQHIQHNGTHLGLKALHTPGHTPDSMAVYDESEHWLFTGDTCYRRVAVMPWGEKQDVPIVFPLQGNWQHYLGSLEKMAAFVQAAEGKSGDGRRVRLAAGHTTSDALAVDLLQAALDFSRNVMAGRVRLVATLPGDSVAPGGSLGEENFVVYQDEGEEVEFSMCAPEGFEKEFARQRGAS